MSRSSLCYQSDAYILVSRTTTITGAENDDAARQLEEINKGVIFKNCTPLIDCISEIILKQIMQNIQIL